MSFWRTFGFHTVSAIDTILDKDDYTLDELLDEEEILQEVKSQNKRLLDYLTQPEVLKILLEYITVEPDADADSKRKFKHPFLACEILCSDVWTICDAIYKDDALVHQLYSFLEQPAPLNHQLANYVCRSAGVLLQRKITETVDYMKKSNMIVHFIRHLNNASVMDLLLKVISCEETSEGSGILDWLCETELIPCLVGKFDAANSADVHENASQALVDIISVSGGVASSPLIRQLESEPIVTALFGHILAQDPPGSALLHGLTVAIELLARAAAEAQSQLDAANDAAALASLPPPLVPPSEMQTSETTGDTEANTAASNEANKDEGDAAAPAANATEAKDESKKEEEKAEELSPLLAQTLARLEAFATLLKTESGVKRRMSTGASMATFGFAKLKISEFFAMVVRLNCAAIDAELQRLDVFSIAMDAFFQFTWNNFLHTTVEQIVGGVLEGDNVALQCSLVTQTKLLERIVEADRENTEEQARPRGYRRGFMGHLTAIALRLQAAAARAPELDALLNADEAWLDYVNGSLAQLRAAESKPLGGHRPMGGPGESSDEDEEELDDDGDSIFDRYQLGFGTDDFADDDSDDEDGDGALDFSNEFVGATPGGTSFEMYEDGGDGSGEEGDWPVTDAAPDVDPAADVAELVANVEQAAGDDNADVVVVQEGDDDNAEADDGAQKSYAAAAASAVEANDTTTADDNGDDNGGDTEEKPSDTPTDEEEKADE